MKYIDAEKLKAKIQKEYLKAKEKARFAADSGTSSDYSKRDAIVREYEYILRIIASLQQEQPKVDYNKFEKLFNDFCERHKGHHITSHDACMWFWELGLNVRKEEDK